MFPAALDDARPESRARGASMTPTSEVDSDVACVKDIDREAMSTTAPSVKAFLAALDDEARPRFEDTAALAAILVQLRIGCNVHRITALA